MFELPAAVDLFAGAGGTSQGLRDAGFRILAAIENDAAAAKSYRANHPDTLLLDDDIRNVKASALARCLDAPIALLTACPPCQGFSTLGSGDPDDERNDLVGSVMRFTRALSPSAVLLENVPGLATDRRLLALELALSRRYVVSRHLVDAANFGVPQHRRRIIVIAVRRPFDPGLAQASLLDLLPEQFERTPQGAGRALALAGPIDGTSDPVHRARRPAPLTLRRIRAMKVVGGGRRDLPDHLQLTCHKRLDGAHATSIYGRIDPARPSPTMTTRCTTPSCGRFVHPYEDRGISLREAALLQTFPLRYVFEGTYGEIERQVGNAVPVRLAEALGLIVQRLLEIHETRSPLPSACDA